MSDDPLLQDMIQRLRACRVCRETPRYGAALPHDPRPIIQGSTTARLCIASQAPGTRAHAAGKSFYDQSGVRLRGWLGLDEAAFYDERRVAIVPMGSCFPGQDDKGGDLPPRRECAPQWHDRLFAALPNVELILAVGWPAQRYHLSRVGLGGLLGANLTETVGRWREIRRASLRPRIFPAPHPSWRNNAWLKRRPWFENELLPALRADLAPLIQPG
jgi:uracil-DNA glycosylase